LLARVFLFFNKAQSCLAETIWLANEERNFPEQPFYKAVIMHQVFFTKIVLRKMVKTKKAADRNFSGALFNQKFPYSTKNFTRSFFRQTCQNAARYSRSRFSFFGRRLFSQNRP